MVLGRGPWVESFLLDGREARSPVRLDFPAGGSQSWAVSRDLGMIAVIDEERRLILFDAVTGAWLAETEVPARGKGSTTNIEFSASGDILLYWSAVAEPQLWEVPSLTPMRGLTGDNKKLEDLHVSFVGDATNVCSSLMWICTHLGMHFTHVAPKAYQVKEDWQVIARENCKASGGTLTVTDDPAAGVKNADFIYTDLWWWVGQEDEIPDRRAAFMPAFQVNKDLLAKAPAHAKVMHCLPASRGVEATDEVLDGPQSIIFDQAENRLHMEKGILVWFVYPRLKRPSTELLAYHKGKIEDYLSIQEHSF